MTACPTMIMVAPNGARRGKQDHPNLPITPDEVCAVAQDCADAGASVLHLHVRNNDAGHTINPDCYRIALEALAAKVGGNIVAQVTSEACGIYTAQEQMDMVWRVRPVAVSLGLNELVPEGSNEAHARKFFKWLKNESISPQFILYSADDVRRFIDLKERGIIPFERPFALFVLGRYAENQQSDPEDLDAFLEARGDEEFPWAMCAFGGRELACVEAAVARGGHVRVGFENNLHLPDGSLADSNTDLVAQAAACIRTHGNTVMTVDQASAFLKDVLQ